jgi:pyruvate dehydrogenase E2 component (dihydrolipoamide acetyltransferase)
VRQLAKQQGVALESLTGSGPGGAITADDVKRAAGPGGVVTASRPAAGAGSATSGADDERIPFRGLRRKIAEHMRRSIEHAAHFTFVAECDMTELAQRRERVKRDAEARGVKLTYLAYIVKALVESLRRHPMLNAVLDEAHGEIVLKRRYHIGIATHTEEGLTVPILHDADRLSVLEIAREIQRLSQAARDTKLKIEELQGGTFTVTSTGSQGGVLATPILHHPQVAILGVHEIKKRPAVVDGAIVARDIGNLSLSLDHRVVDGAVGAGFLYDLVARLERPDTWVGEGDRS